MFIGPGSNTSLQNRLANLESFENKVGDFLESIRDYGPPHDPIGVSGGEWTKDFISRIGIAFERKDDAQNQESPGEIEEWEEAEEEYEEDDVMGNLTMEEEMSVDSDNSTVGMY